METRRRPLQKLPKVMKVTRRLLQKVKLDNFQHCANFPHDYAENTTNTAASAEDGATTDDATIEAGKTITHSRN